MADIIFLKNVNGKLFKCEGDDVIHQFVIRKRKKYEGSETVRYVCDKLFLVEPDPCVRDRIMARWFIIPGCVTAVARVGQISNDRFAMLVKEMKDHLSYMLFPMAPEFDYCQGYGPGFGGVLMRSLAHVPYNTSTYFLHDWTLQNGDDGFGPGLVGSSPLPRNKSCLW